MAGDLIIHASPDPVKMAAFGAAATLVTALAAAYPAWRAARLKPVEALRTR